MPDPTEDPGAAAASLACAILTVCLRRDENVSDDVNLLLEEFRELNISTGDLVGIVLATAAGLIQGACDVLDVDPSPLLQRVATGAHLND